MRPATGAVEAFRHEALFYAGRDEFVARASAFICDGIEAGERVMVATSAIKIDQLRDELGSVADCVLFADMEEIGQNPARIIPAWRAFVSEHAGEGPAIRGIGEPIWPERSPAELVESTAFNTAEAPARCVSGRIATL